MREKAGEAIRTAAEAYGLLLFVVLPLYMRNGYAMIGDVKYQFFRNVTILFFVLLSVLQFLRYAGGRKKEQGCGGGNGQGCNGKEGRGPGDRGIHVGAGEKVQGSDGRENHAKVGEECQGSESGYLIPPGLVGSSLRGRTGKQGAVSEVLPDRVVLSGCGAAGRAGHPDQGADPGGGRLPAGTLVPEGTRGGADCFYRAVYGVFAVNDVIQRFKKKIKKVIDITIPFC